MRISNFLLKPLLVLAVAVPAMTTFNVGDAEARHKYRGAVVAGAIIGGAIAYHHYKKRKHYRYHGRYAHPRYRVRHHHRYYGHRHVPRGYYKRNRYHGHYRGPYILGSGPYR